MIFSKVSRLEKQMAVARTYQEWRDAASLLDKAKKLDKWRRTESSPHYDYRSIRRRLEQLKMLRLQADFPGILFALNEGIHGNMGGMGKSVLYEQANVGTKELIEKYIEEVATNLELLSRPRANIDEEERLAFLDRASHCFGASALMMSGSGTLAYFHLGVAYALWRENLIPNVISGSSGGSLIGSILATHTDAELAEFFEARHFINNDPNMGGWLEKYKFKIVSTESFRGLVEKLLPNLTFQEAYEKTGRFVNISIAPSETHQTSRLLSATTSPNVFIREAVMASCAVPGVYPAVTLKAKNQNGFTKDYLPSRKWVDGAISDDLPAKRLSRLYGVNHYIVSQTNPHILPFISESKNSVTGHLKKAISNTAREWINAGANIFNGPLSEFPTLQHISNSMLAILNQDYMGDINILPPFKFRNPARLLAPLTEEEIEELVILGQKATWPKIEMIRIQTKISRLLDQIIDEQDQSAQQVTPQPVELLQK